jgi:hypothetical protein
MDNNISISTINDYFTLYNEKDNHIKNIKKIQKIVEYSSISINEANIANKIKKIPYYTNYFLVLDDYELLNISQLNEHIFEKLTNIKTIYYLFKYSNVSSIDFTDYIYNFTSIKELIFGIINSFSPILTALTILNQNSICFFDISPKNILFNRGRPLLNNFKLSLRLNKLDFTYFSNILNKLDNFTYQPLEIHFLFYYLKNDILTISNSFIEDFCKTFVENLNILRLFSENYKTLYKDKCVETIKKYIKRSRNEIIDDILERSDKWDVYGISLLYIQIFGCISRVFSLKGTFISKIILEFSKNLHPDSDNRMTLEETLYKFNMLLNQKENWNFINKLNNNKLNELFNELSR